MITMSFIFSQKSPKLPGGACKIGKRSQNWRRGAPISAKLAQGCLKMLLVLFEICTR